jgi:DDE superfamily endonuclease
MVYAFFDMLEREIDQLHLCSKPPSIYNADETGLQLHLRPGKILAAKGDRSVLQITNSERDENVTVTGCCNAAENYIPPMVIFKGQRNKPEFEDGMPAGTAVKTSDSGHISSELFLFWLQHFNSHRCQGSHLIT